MIAEKIDKGAVIAAVGASIRHLAPAVRVDLLHPDVVVRIAVFGATCDLSVLPSFQQLCQYNLRDSCMRSQVEGVLA